MKWILKKPVVMGPPGEHPGLFLFQKAFRVLQC